MTCCKHAVSQISTVMWQCAENKEINIEEGKKLDPKIYTISSSLRWNSILRQHWSLVLIFSSNYFAIFVSVEIRYSSILSKWPPTFWTSSFAFCSQRIFRAVVVVQLIDILLTWIFTEKQRWSWLLNELNLKNEK